MTDLTRRAALAAGCSGVLAATLPPAPARAAAPAAGRQVPGIYRYKVGDFELTAITDGIGMRPIEDGFVKNASLPDVRAALEKAFLPTDKLGIPYTQLVVNTGRRMVLIDTGTGGQMGPMAGTLIENLDAAGIDPKAIDAVVISHFHGDHILGLQTKDGQPAFPNAEVMVPEDEWAFWMDEGEMSRAPGGQKRAFENARKTFNPIARTVGKYQADAELVPGINAHAAYGHTPGHMIFRVSSGADQLIVLSDTTNHPALFVRNPGWHAVVDMDPNLAEETRRRVLDMVSTDRMRMQGYHFPFPATGHIAKQGDRYEYVPSAWSPIL